jgi:hypothetical protein
VIVTEPIQTAGRFKIGQTSTTPPQSRRRPVTDSNGEAGARDGRRQRSGGGGGGTAAARHGVSSGASASTKGVMMASRAGTCTFSRAYDSATAAAARHPTVTRANAPSQLVARMPGAVRCGYPPLPLIGSGSKPFSTVRYTGRGQRRRCGGR